MAYKKVMNTEQFKEKLDLALKNKSLYVLGAFGAPATAKNKNRYSTNCSYNKSRATMIQSASADTFFFDCAGLVKGIIWGWNADMSKVYGGAQYASNTMPDSGNLIGLCEKVSTDFSNIQPFELVYGNFAGSGHVGIYLGDGIVEECSPKWANGVQLSNLGNLKMYATGNYRIWQKHGFLPWIDYTTKAVEPVTNLEAPKSDNTYTTVVKGDSLIKIANKLKKQGINIKWQDIAKINGIKFPYTIYPGQKLKLK